MPRQKNKKTARVVSKKTAVSESLDPLRTGMPARDSIVDVKEFRKGKKVYRLIQTNEVDEYERPASKTKRKGPTR